MVTQKRRRAVLPSHSAGNPYPSESVCEPGVWNTSRLISRVHRVPGVQVTTFASSVPRRSCPPHHVIDHVLKRGGVELVHNLLSISLGEDQARLAQHAEVARNCWPGRLELSRDFARRISALTQQVQDPATRRIAQSAISVSHDPQILASQLITQERNNPSAVYLVC